MRRSRSLQPRIDGRAPRRTGARRDGGPRRCCCVCCCCVGRAVEPAAIAIPAVVAKKATPALHRRPKNRFVVVLEVRDLQDDRPEWAIGLDVAPVSSGNDLMRRPALGEPAAEGRGVVAPHPDDEDRGLVVGSGVRPDADDERHGRRRRRRVATNAPSRAGWSGAGREEGGRVVGGWVGVYTAQRKARRAKDAAVGASSSPRREEELMT